LILRGTLPPNEEEGKEFSHNKDGDGRFHHHAPIFAPYGSVVLLREPPEKFVFKAIIVTGEASH
jgi:hypothetical protein